MARIAIDNNPSKIAEQTQTVKNALSTITNVLTQLEPINIRFSTSELTSIVADARGSLSDLKYDLARRIRLQQSAAIENENITVMGIKLNKAKFLDLIEIPDVSNIALKLRDLPHSGTGLRLIRQFIAITDFTATLADGYEQSIIDANTVYAETANEIKRYELLKAVVDAANALNESKIS